MQQQMVKILIAVLVLIAMPQYAAASAEIGVTSNYVFRGYTKSNDGPALQGGAEYMGGYYAGLWGSQVSNGTNSGIEVDGYLGLKGKLGGPLGFDLGAITYQHTDTAFTSSTELYGGLSAGAASFTYYSGSTSASATYTYIDFKVRVGLADKAFMDVHFGHYDGGATDMLVGLSKEMIGLMFNVSVTTRTNSNNNASKLFVSVKKEF